MDREQLAVLADALGDAIQYRIGDDSDEPADHHGAREYQRLADALGITPSDCPIPSDELADEYEEWRRDRSEGRGR